LNWKPRLSHVCRIAARYLGGLSFASGQRLARKSCKQALTLTADGGFGCNQDFATSIEPQLAQRQLHCYAFTAMVHSMLEWITSAVLICLGVCGALAGRRMVEDVNAQRPFGEKFNKWLATPITFRSVWRTHQVLYPKSRLPLICLLSSTGIVACFVLFAIVNALSR